MSRVGVMFFYGGTSAPTGALACTGQAVSRTTYADLFTAIGTTWDTFNGAAAPAGTDFRLPPSLDSSLPVYPCAMNSGTDNVGDFKAGQNLQHNHTATTSEDGSHQHSFSFKRPASNTGHWSGSSSEWLAGTYSKTETTNTTGSHTHATTTINNEGGSEFRPESVSGLWCIWYEA